MLGSQHLSLPLSRGEVAYVCVPPSPGPWLCVRQKLGNSLVGGSLEIDYEASRKLP